MSVEQWFRSFGFGIVGGIVFDHQACPLESDADDEYIDFLYHSGQVAEEFPQLA